MNLLTPQERECLRHVARQRSSKEIAAALGISKASVDTYCNRARAKLGVASRRDAAELVAAYDQVESAAAPPPTAATLVAPAVEPPPPPTISLLPPVASLGIGGRLAVVLGGAVVLALAFGMLVSGLKSLDEVVAASRAAPPVERSN